MSVSVLADLNCLDWLVVVVLVLTAANGTRRGFLVGGIVGALVSLAGLAVAGCGSASSPECFGEVVLVVGGFGGLGAGMGSLVGSGTYSIA